MGSLDGSGFRPRPLIAPVVTRITDASHRPADGEDPDRLECRRLVEGDDEVDRALGLPLAQESGVLSSGSATVFRIAVSAITFCIR